jgi:hypothetical protein
MPSLHNPVSRQESRSNSFITFGKNLGENNHITNNPINKNLYLIPIFANIENQIDSNAKTENKVYKIICRLIVSDTPIFATTIKSKYKTNNDRNKQKTNFVKIIKNILKKFFIHIL